MHPGRGGKADATDLKAIAYLQKQGEIPQIPKKSTQTFAKPSQMTI
jgi:hypothetical protein